MANLKWGSKGSQVKSVQQKLNKAGAKPKLNPDGVFGKATYEAVRAFQKARRIGIDGAVGPKTLAELDGGGGSKAKKPPEWPYDEVTPKDLKGAVELFEVNEKTSLDAMAELSKLNHKDAEAVRKKILQATGALTSTFKVYYTAMVALSKSYGEFKKAAKNDPKKAAEIVKVAKPQSQACDKTWKAFEKAGEQLLYQFEESDKIRSKLTGEDMGIGTKWPYPKDLLKTSREVQKLAKDTETKALGLMKTLAKDRGETAQEARTSLMRSAGQLSNRLTAMADAGDAYAKIKARFDKVNFHDPEAAEKAVKEAKAPHDRFVKERDAIKKDARVVVEEIAEVQEQLRRD